MFVEHSCTAFGMDAPDNKVWFDKTVTVNFVIGMQGSCILIHLILFNFISFC